MTANALEMVLYDLGVKRDARQSFKDDADKFLERYRLDPEECFLVKNFDVGGLQARGVSALLTLGFWMMNEPGRSRAEYLRRLRATEAAHG